jgi:dihydroflavonol-4-reductase
MVVDAAAGRMPAFVDTGLNVVHVDDVAAGHVAALRRGRIGQHYILGGENVTLATVLSEIALQTGRRPPVLRLPIAAVYPIAFSAELYARIAGSKPFVNLDQVRMARHHMFFTAAKAHSELGYKARPYREAIADAISWFKTHGYLN